MMPHTQKELLFIIIDTYMETLQKRINKSTGISLRSDGSVDRTHVDKIYTITKLVDKVGNESLIFLGVWELLERWARGIFNTMIKSMENLLG